MSLIITIIVFLVINYVTDFLFQRKKEAENKSKSLYWLTVHAGTYTTYFAGLVTMYNLFTHTFDWNYLYWLCLINGAAHFIVDFITSKMTTYFYMAKQFRAFLKTIGLDTLIHNIILIITIFLFINK